MCIVCCLPVDVMWSSDVMCGQCQLELDQRTEQYDELVSSLQTWKNIAMAAFAAAAVLFFVAMAMCCKNCCCKGSVDPLDDVGGASGLKVQV